MNVPDSVLEHLGLTLVKQYYRPPGPTNVEWFVVLIQYQYRKVEYRQGFSPILGKPIVLRMR